MKRQGPGLLLRFAIAASLIIIITPSLLAIFLGNIERSRVEAEIKNKGLTLAQNLAFNSEYGILSENVDALDRLAKALMEEQDVVLVQILDATGKVLVKKQKAGAAALNIYNITYPVKSILVERSPEEIGLAPISAGAKPGQEEIVGKVRLGISLARVSAIVGQLIIVIIASTLVVIFLGILGISLLTRYFLYAPLRQFVVGTQKISAGDFTHQIKLESRDEIGELADSFNSMTEELNKARAQLSSYAKDLENKVSERTKDLENKTRELEKAKTGLEEQVVKRTQELEKERASLEIKVKERTAELQDKVEELKEFNDLAVGRELKMIELEKEIEQLKREAKK